MNKDKFTGYKRTVPKKIIGAFYHESTMLYMPIEKPISWFKRIVLRLILGFKYIEY
mgnify:CR=1 FL=1